MGRQDAAPRDPLRGRGGPATLRGRGARDCLGHPVHVHARAAVPVGGVRASPGQPNSGAGALVHRAGHVHLCRRCIRARPPGPGPGRPQSSFNQGNCRAAICMSTATIPARRLASVRAPRRLLITLASSTACGSAPSSSTSTSPCFACPRMTISPICLRGEPASASAALPAGRRRSVAQRGRRALATHRRGAHAPVARRSLLARGRLERSVLGAPLRLNCAPCSAPGPSCGAGRRGSVFRAAARRSARRVTSQAGSARLLQQARCSHHPWD